MKWRKKVLNHAPALVMLLVAFLILPYFVSFSHGEFYRDYRSRHWSLESDEFTQRAIQADDITRCLGMKHAFIELYGTPEFEIRNSCIIHFAKAKGDVDYCAYIDGRSSEDRYECYGAVARVTNDVSICDTYFPYEKTNIRSYLCYAHFIPALGKQLCDRLPLSTSRDMCYSRHAEIVGDEQFCELIGGEREKSGCYQARITHKAITNKDASLCDADVLYLSQKDDCYERYAQNYRDSSTCSLIENPASHDECYRYLSKKLLDDRVCEGIIDAGRKDACYDDLN